MKTILIAVDTYYPKKDGVVRFLENIVPRLSKKYRIKILAPDFGKTEEDLDVIKFPVYKKREFAGYHPVIWNKKAKNVLKNSIKEADIVFSQDVALLGRKAIVYGYKARKPTINYVHQIGWDQVASIATKHVIIRRIFTEIIKWLTKSTYKKCDLLLVPSITVAEQLKNENVGKEREIVPLGIDIEKFRPPANKNSAKIEVGIDPNKFVIGYCGRISKEKDLGTLMEAFREINKKYPDTVLLIIGGGDEEETRALGKIPKTKVTGFVKNVVPYLQALDIFVLPSMTETTSLATMEAMGCGVPALTTPVGRLRELVKNNYNGFLFPKRSVEVLAKRIEELINDRDKKDILARNARKTIINFSWSLTVGKMAEIFEKLLRQT